MTASFFEFAIPVHTIVESSNRRLEFRNWTAMWLWGFAAAWLGMLGLMTVLFVTTGVSGRSSPALMLLVLIIFWMAGAALLVHVLGKACITVVVMPRESVQVSWRYPLRRILVVVPVSLVSAAEVVETVDDDNDAYFTARWTLPDGRAVALAEGSNRDLAEQTCRRFNRAVDASMASPIKPA